MILVVLCSLWVLCAAAVALLPMRYQYAPGLALLLAAPVLLIWIGVRAGPVWVLLAALAVTSMFRKPLRYFAAYTRDLLIRKTP